ncbi:selenium-binding protein SBP56-related protein [Pelagibius sp. Alg239-R121]|uniref:selenium-binding protein SBP56-related protein n=1 Tax=Pelagibius sp. Alg239-R121 TaxID=2993448 RepID=UPI0024A7535A|nr:selenium-binding protein SBP56-related protein [Pelagibius sp. Alg239-R121]
MKQLKNKLAAGFVALFAFGTTPVIADETCQSPYMPKITGQEEFVYVWTLGEAGVGDESDKLVTVDVRPESDSYGKVIASLSVGGLNEAHHGGFSADRRYFWAGGLDTNKIFIFDIHSDAAKPKLHKVVDSFVKDSGGAVGPHTFYGLPGRMMITALSNDKDHGGRTALVEYTNEGDYVATYWMPTAENPQGAKIDSPVVDGFGYDVRALIRKNIMLTSSFTGWSNYMMDFGKMLKDEAAMKRFGQTVVQWDLHTRQPKKVMHVPGAPLEIRFPWGPNSNYAFTTTALTSKLWLIHEDDEGEWHSKPVADIGDPSKVPLPVDISIAADDQHLWINSFLDGMTRLFDISDPHAPKQVYEKKIASQVNMVSQSWDGKRVYFTSSLLANWDKKGADNEQFLKAYDWNGKELIEKFSIDFHKEGLGRAHIMRFGSSKLYSS